MKTALEALRNPAILISRNTQVREINSVWDRKNLWAPIK